MKQFNKLPSVNKAQYVTKAKTESVDLFDSLIKSPRHKTEIKDNLSYGIRNMGVLCDKPFVEHGREYLV